MCASCLACPAPGTPGGEHGDGAVAEGAVRPSLFVVGPPRTEDLVVLGERTKPVLVQAVVEELTVESLHVRVQRRFAGMNQTQRRTAAVGPSIERFSDELGTLIGSQQPRQIGECADPITTRIT